MPIKNKYIEYCLIWFICILLAIIGVAFSKENIKKIACKILGMLFLAMIPSAIIAIFLLLLYLITKEHLLSQGKPEIVIHLSTLISIIILNILSLLIHFSLLLENDKKHRSYSKNAISHSELTEKTLSIITILTLYTITLTRMPITEFNNETEIIFNIAKIILLGIFSPIFLAELLEKFYFRLKYKIFIYYLHIINEIGARKLILENYNFNKDEFEKHNMHYLILNKKNNYLPSFSLLNFLTILIFIIITCCFFIFSIRMGLFLSPL